MAIAFVSSGANGAAATSVAVTVSTTGGNDVVVCVSLRSTATPTAKVVSVTDSGGSNYVFRAGADDNAGTVGGRGELWSARNVVASTSVTVTGDANTTGISAVVLEYSGVAALGITVTNSGTGTTETVSLTTQDNNNWIAAGNHQHQNKAFTASVGNLRNSFLQTAASTAGGDNTSAAPASVTFATTTALAQDWAATALELRTVAPAAAAAHLLPLMGAGPG